MQMIILDVKFLKKYLKKITYKKNKMDKDNAIGLIIKLIKDGKKSYHEWYDRCVNYAKLSTQLITGEGMDDLLKRFVRRESSDEFNQRKTITQHITTAVTKNLIDVQYKVPRSSGIKKFIIYEDNYKNNIGKLQQIMQDYWGDNSLDNYTDNRFIELSNIDPNSFTAIEFEYDEEKKVNQAYPLEIYSHEAIYYPYEKNKLTHLVCKKNNNYTLYAAQFNVSFIEIEENSIKNKAELFEIDGKRYFTYNQKIYLIEIYEHGLPTIPAYRNGYVRDLYTNGQTFINAINSAYPFLLKSIKANSELDLTMALVAYPQKIMYAQPCDNPECYNGKLQDGKSICPSCKGTGAKIPSSVQDAIILPIPKDVDNILTPDQIMSYKAPGVDILKWQNEYIEKLTEYCRRVVFNTDIFDKKEISETATGKRIDLDNVYDALYPQAKRYEKIWEFSVSTIAFYAGISKGLTADMIVGRDFKMLSKDDIISMIKRANDADVDFHISDILTNDLVELLYQDDEYQVKKYRTQKKFFPFPGKSPEEIQVILSGNYVIEQYAILYDYYSVIFNEIEIDMYNSEISFYELARNKQWEIIKKKINDLSDRIKKIEQPQINF